MANKPTPKPKAKPKGLNDFLKQGKTPPSKNKKGIPSDADVVIKGYNDKKTAAKEKLKADMKSGKMKRVESGMTGAMVAKVAGKVITKAAKAAKDAKAASKAKEAAKTAKIASNSVKVKEVDKNVPRYVIANRNKVATEMAARRKSGELAKTTAARVNTNPAPSRTGKDRIVVKINSNKK